MHINYYHQNAEIEWLKKKKKCWQQIAYWLPFPNPKRIEHVRFVGGEFFNSIIIKKQPYKKILRFYHCIYDGNTNEWMSIEWKERKKLRWKHNM